MRSNFLKLMMFAAILVSWSTAANSQTVQGNPTLNGCYDGSQYVNNKNNPTAWGGYTLQDGFQEKAAQTYRYEGSGTLSRVRVYGEYPGFGPILFGTVPLRVVVYNVDANNRPTSTISSVNISWNAVNEYEGFKDVNISPVNISGNFAVAVELRSLTDAFRIAYTGDGEGLGEDLASLAGTLTGFNWSSAMTNFSKDGDLRIVPYVMSNLVANFSANATCVTVGQSISFTNNSQVETGGMFNVINRTGYIGTNTNYAWNFGDATTSTAENPTKSFTTAGRKTVSLTVSHETWGGGVCTDYYEMDISVGLGMTASNLVNASCNGTSDGSVTANVIGGAAPYDFSLNGGEWTNGNIFDELPAGTHTIVTMDDLGCQTSVNFTITQPTAITFTSTNSTNSTCGQANGAILVNATGGTGTISYSLNGGASQSSGSFQNLSSSAGYVIEAEDVNGCTSEVTVAVNDQGAPSISLLSATNISCNNGNDGTIVVLGSGGSGALQYSINGTTYQSSGTFTGLFSGRYIVSVRDAAGCTRGFPISLVQPNAIAIVSIEENQPVSCNGGNDGVLEIINSIGGIGTHTFSINGVNFQTGRVFSGLSAGTYTVTVRDAAGCTATETATVTQPSVLTATTIHGNLSCNGSYDGYIIVLTNGGNERYQYQLAGSSSWQYSNTFNDLAAGTYTVNVKDAKDCRSSVTVTITQPSPITATVTTGTAACGGSDGTASIAAAGGSGSDYQYSINLGVSFQSSGAFTGLSTGTYSIIVRDGSGCYNSFQATINSTTGPAISTLSNTGITCYNGSDGSISVAATGGTGTLEYSVGGAYQTTGSFVGLPAGFYTLTVRDAVGCFDSDTITLNQGNPIAVTATVNNNVSCFGGNNGSITIAAAGGIGTLAFSLNGTNYQSIGTFTGLTSNALYTAYVRDAGGCTNFTNFSISQPTQIVGSLGIVGVNCADADNGTIFVTASGGTGTLQYSLGGAAYGNTNSWSNLAAANYIVYVRDAFNCTIGLLATVNEPAPIALGVTLDHVNCAGGNDGSINMSVSGGIVPYAYAWTNGARLEDLFNLSSGTYGVVVTDANGCTAANSYSIVAPATPIIVNGTVDNASNSGVSDGAIDITVNGGTSPYNFEWSNGAVTEDVSAINSGFYIVVVTDANGCESSQIFNVSIGSSVDQTQLSETNVQIFPNPARDFVNVELAGFDGSVIESVNVIDALGQLVYSVQANSDKVQLNTAELSAGFYMILVEVNGQRITQKLNIAK